MMLIHKQSPMLLPFVAALMTGLILPLTAAQPQNDKAPAKRENFTVAGHKAFVMLPPNAPANATNAKPMRWVWYAPTLGKGLPGGAEKWMFDRLHAAGIAIAGIDVGESYGSPKGRAIYQKLYEELTGKRGFYGKPVLLARSRGGLMLYSWAVEHPESVGGIAGIYPVCNLTSYPGVKRAAGAFEMTAQELKAKLAEHNPIDRLAPLAKAKVPIFHIHGDKDGTVPLESNSAELAKRYAAFGGPVEIEVIKGQGHNMWKGWFESQKLTDFMIAQANRPARGASDLATTNTTPNTTPRPNIVIIVADDLGWKDVGYHAGDIATPNIDRLATQGVRLSNWHVAPLCSPTRAGLMTGRWPIRYGMGESVITPWRKWGLPTTERTIADLLATAGYQRRGAVGKWHLGHYKKQLLPLNRGFTFFYGHYNGAFDYFTHKREGQLDWHRNFDTSRDKGYSTDLIGREAAAFIDKSPAGKPFFLYVPFNAPHDPMQAKEADLAKYAKVKNQKRRIYSAMVDSMDQAIGVVLEALERKKIADNTFVLFFSDNGALSWGNNKPWRGGKGSVYEGGVRTPALVRWPAGGLSGGRKVDGMMGMIDIYPTLKRLAGVKLKDRNRLDGIDMLDVMRGKTKAPARDWFSYIAQGRPDQTAVCDDTWKLVVTGGSVLDVKLDQDGGKAPKVELFRMDRDPAESKNLLKEHPDVAAAMLKRLQEFRRLKIDGIPDFLEGRKGFVAPGDWVIE